jgi:hypothetical protein
MNKDLLTLMAQFASLRAVDAKIFFHWATTGILMSIPRLVPLSVALLTAPLPTAVQLLAGLRRELKRR